MLKEYKVLAINGHSEYWSAEVYDGVDRYLKAGGNVAVFSGNTMFWRVSYSEDGSVMECRKFDRDAAAREGSTLGEIWHSHDGRRGGLSCECGYPAWKVVGLEFLGWSSSKVSTFQAYEVDTADHFLFQQPEKVGVKPGEFFGKSPDGPVPIALGHEWDVRLSTMAKLTPKPFPEGVQMLDEPKGIVTLAHGNDAERRSRHLDFFMRRAPNPEGYLCDMIYWDRPEGGRVFNAGAIGSGWVLSADPKFGTLIKNVLNHFGVKA